jgi:hypothetical protein
MADDLTERARGHAIAVLRSVGDQLAAAPQRQAFGTLLAMGGLVTELEEVNRRLEGAVRGTGAGKRRPTWRAPSSTRSAST